MSLLFRSEALDAKRDQYLGTIRIGRNPSFTVVTVISIALAFALVAFAVWGQVTRKARLTGLLMPTLGTLQLTANATGVLTDVRVNEGDVVRVGQTLFVVGTDRTTVAGNTTTLVAQNLAQRRLTLQTERTSRELQFRQREQALADRIRSTEAELRQADAELQLMTHRVALATKTFERYQQLSREGFVADLQAQQKQEELLDLQGRAQTAERNRTALGRDVQSLNAERIATSTQLQTDLAQLDRSIASLDQEGTENDARRQVVIVAPSAGTVTALNLHAGQAVQAGQTIATLVPETAKGNASELEAQLFAPSRTAGFVRPGQKVWVRYSAYPYQKFGMHGGTITNVSRTPINPQDLPAGQGQALMSAAQTTEPLYRISVKLGAQTVSTFGQVQSLKPGMTLEADVVQDQRAVWEWMLEPVIAVTGATKVLSADPNKAFQGG